MAVYEVRGLPRTLAQEEEQQTETGTEAEELIFGALAFLAVFVVLARFAFPRINQGLKQRTDKIKEDLEKAEASRNEAQGILERYESQLQEARSEANRIIEESRRTAESMRRDLLAKAEEEANQVVARAQEEIRTERDRAFGELRRQVGELSVELASRVVGTELNKQKQMSLVDGYIDELTEMEPAGNGRSAGGGRKEGSE
jgi:F-type H+-transporting ATPase subunit b